MTRRDFLQAGVALPLIRPAAEQRNCILLLLTGGPSHLDTWDMKPDAPREIRGPFRPIRTNVPGIEISEIFPRMARHADQYALIRSVYHNEEPVHETGLQLIQTGALSGGSHVGCHIAAHRNSQHIVLPGLLGFMGGVMPTGQPNRERGGIAPFAQNCFRARQLVESGVLFVTVNMFDTVFHRTTWDSHGAKPFSSIADYKDHVGPIFDRAFTALLRNPPANTLLVAMGEMGRTPRINPAGGRDHWAKCWTILMAGAGIRGGQVYGSSDSIGAEPRDNPVTPAMVVSTICHAMGVPLLQPGAEPIRAVLTA